MEALERDELFEVLEQLQFEGKIRHYGVALGPDIGWFEEGEMSMRERQVESLQIIYSILEMEPAIDFFPIAEECEVGLLSRVPHASNTLTGSSRRCRSSTVGPPGVSERRVDARGAGQGGAGQVPGAGGHEDHGTVGPAIRAEKAADRVGAAELHQDGELHEYTAAVDTPPLTDQEQGYLDELWQNKFYLEDVEPAFREI